MPAQEEPRNPGYPKERADGTQIPRDNPHPQMEVLAQQLYAQYADRIEKLAAARFSAAVARRIDPEDIVQSVLRRFFTHQETSPNPIPQGDHLWKLLLVMTLNRIRAEETRQRAAKRDIRLTMALSALESSTQAKLLHQSRENFQDDLVLQELLEALPPYAREIVRLRMEGHRMSEIAEIVGRSKRTVDRNLRDAKELLKELLQEQE